MRCWKLYCIDTRFYENLGYEVFYDENIEGGSTLALSKNDDSLTTFAKVIEINQFKHLFIDYDYFTEEPYTLENLQMQLLFWEHSPFAKDCDFISLVGDREDKLLVKNLSTIHYEILSSDCLPFLYQFYQINPVSYIKVLHSRVDLIHSFVKDIKNCVTSVQKKHPSFEFFPERLRENFAFYGFKTSSIIALSEKSISLSFKGLNEKINYSGNATELDEFFHSIVKSVIEKMRIDNLYDPPKLFFNRYCNTFTKNQDWKEWIYQTFRQKYTDLEIEDTFALLFNQLKSGKIKKIETFLFQVENSPMIKIIPLLDYVFVVEHEISYDKIKKNHYPISELKFVTNKYKEKMISHLENELNSFTETDMS